MKELLEKNGLSVPKAVLSAILVACGLLSLIYVGMTSNALFSYFYCIATVGFVLLPAALSVLFRWNMNFLFYAFFSLYAMGPLLGAVYNLYYYTPWWDDLLHAMAGTVFAVIGAYIALAMCKNHNPSYLVIALFGVLFSIAIAVFWEFYEFSADMLLGSDMQADTIIHKFATKINSLNGEVIVFEDITGTLVNGQDLGINGYLDIGLIDTMTDMFTETLGAVIYFIYAVIDKDRHPLISRYERAKKTATPKENAA